MVQFPPSCFLEARVLHWAGLVRQMPEGDIAPLFAKTWHRRKLPEIRCRALLIAENCLDQPHRAFLLAFLLEIPFPKKYVLQKKRVSLHNLPDHIQVFLAPASLWKMNDADYALARPIFDILLSRYRAGASHNWTPFPQWQQSLTYEPAQ